MVVQMLLRILIGNFVKLSLPAASYGERYLRILSIFRDQAFGGTRFIASAFIGHAGAWPSICSYPESQGCQDYLQPHRFYGMGIKIKSAELSNCEVKICLKKH